MVTRILSENEQDLRLAGEIIAAGGLVAFPTETVYGLGANALDPDAVRKIYEAKGRPSDNPTIVHIADESALKQLTWRVTPDMQRLARKYWPGPLTMVVPRRDTVPNVTTGNLDTVGVRMPDHVTARALIQAAGCPIAAPSANLSGKPSPTTVEHVIDDMDGRIDAIIRSTPCTIGIESTVIDMTGELPMILRPGFITRADLERVASGVATDPAIEGPPAKDLVPRAPGMKYRHYAPKAEMTIFRGSPEAVRHRITEELCAAKKQGLRSAVLCTSEHAAYYNTDILKCVGSSASDEEIARNLYRCLREFDDEGAQVIFSEQFDGGRLEDAIQNRLLKAAGYRVVTV